MTFDDVINFFGGPSGVSKTLKISPQAIHKWKRADFVPIKAQAKIEIITKGTLKAEKLVPIDASEISDIYGSIDNAAAELGVNLYTVCTWVVQDRISYRYLKQILAKKNSK